MGYKKVLLLFLFQTAAVFSAEETPTFSRSSYFTTRENKQLKGYVVKRIDSPSLLSCGQQCMRNVWCTSTNYKMSSKKDGKGTCELNKHDISLINENDNLHDQQGVTFSMALKGCLINVCLNGGSCFPNKEKQTFSCSCQLPWTGDKCELKMDCPQDWVRHGYSCYHSIDTPTPKWSEARMTCQNLSGDLVIVRSAKENSFIVDLFMKEGIDGIWLGLKRTANNEFYWIDDTPLVGQYDAWAYREPNNPKDQCVQMYSDLKKRGQWNDVPCNRRGKGLIIVCQKRSF